MTKITIAAAAAVLALCACGKDDKGTPSEKGGVLQKKPITWSERKVGSLPVMASLPDGATLEESKLDMGGVRMSVMHDGDCGFFYIDEVGEMSDKPEAIQKQAETAGGVKEWKVKEMPGDGTFRMEWTGGTISDPAETKHSVAYRVKAGSKMYDCGKNGMEPDAEQCVKKVCASLKPAS